MSILQRTKCVSHSKVGTFQRRTALMISAAAVAFVVAAPANAQIMITDDTPVSNPGPNGVTSAAGVTQTVGSGDNIELEDQSSDNAVISLAGTHINNDGDDEDVVVFVDNSEDDITINVLSTGVLQGLDGVIFYEGDGAIIDNAGLIEGTGEAPKLLFILTATPTAI